MIKLLVILTIILLISCGENTIPNSRNFKFKNPSITSFYFDQVCQGDSCSYIHYLMLSSYEDENFNDYDFVYLSDKYLDSVQTHLPVAAIEFCKPFKFKDIGGSENGEQITKNAITLLWFENQSLTNKVPEISHVSIWTESGRKDLDYIHVENRQHRMKVYNDEK